MYVKGHTYSLLWEWKLVYRLWKSLWKVIEMLNIDLLDDLTAPVLGMYSKGTYPTLEIPAKPCPLLYSQYPGNRLGLDAHQLMNG